MGLGAAGSQRRMWSLLYRGRQEAEGKKQRFRREKVKMVGSQGLHWKAEKWRGNLTAHYEQESKEAG